MTGLVARMGGQAVRNEGTAGNMDGRQATSGCGMPAVSDGPGVIGTVSDVCPKARAHPLACETHPLGARTCHRAGDRAWVTYRRFWTSWMSSYRVSEGPGGMLEGVDRLSCALGACGGQGDAHRGRVVLTSRRGFRGHRWCWGTA